MILAANFFCVNFKHINKKTKQNKKHLSNFFTSAQAAILFL